MNRALLTCLLLAVFPILGRSASADQNNPTGKEESMTLPVVYNLAQLDINGPVLASYPETVRRGIEWLQSTDLAALPLGRQEIDGDKVYANVQEYETKETFGIEAHRRYIDIQMLVFGKEILGVIPVSDDLPVTTPYSDKDDYLLFDPAAIPFLKQSAEHPGRLILGPGQCVIFTPSDAHAPGLAAGQPEKVRKIVVKCLCAE